MWWVGIAIMIMGFVGQNEINKLSARIEKLEDKLKRLEYKISDAHE